MSTWDHIAAFLDMSGQALYVWGAYAMVVAAGVWEGAILWQRRRRANGERPARESSAPISR